MKIEFEHTENGNTSAYLFRWYDQNGTLALEQELAVQFVPVVAGTNPSHCIVSGGGINKPAAPAPGTTFTIRVASKNAAGVGPESASSAPFSMSPPVAPTNVVVTNPLT